MPHKRAKRSVRTARQEAKGMDNAPTSKGSAKDGHFSSLPKNAMRILNAGKIQAEYNAKKRAAAEAAKAGLSLPADDDAPGGLANGAGKGKSKAVQSNAGLKIRPGEKLGDFNRRVEQAMAASVAATARSEARRVKKRKRAEAEKAAAEKEEREAQEAEEARRKAIAERKGKGKAEGDPTSEDLKRARMQMLHKQREERGDLDFAKVSQVKRVRDVADAPPRLTKLPRGESASAQANKARLAAVLSGQDSDAAANDVLAAAGGRKVSKGQMPEPIVKPGGLRREKELLEERERAIKMYRQQRQAKFEGR